MTKNAQNESDGARKCVFMELQTIFEEFEVLTDEELMGIRAGGIDYHYESSISSLIEFGGSYGDGINTPK
ncbi:bacteriocin [Lactococcus lactis]|uniref:bacteriocin n=1 Tax=Lactococcus lactis TaxID=1358 RepID=UPI000CE37D48|nr:bacteriocin [Lactococcus lactis]MCU5752931.1 bacteriocin [Lactococcus lactis]MCZ8491190.1 bacteriocin [Lactococcus lactis]MDG4963594.1 bacteriocin [Lactococcus lactis]PPA66711.1 bacteriocin [Lactococcus lactis]WKG35166.1 bacteriocin [Lactococcus lactis subsp. lactis]